MTSIQKILQDYSFSCVQEKSAMLSLGFAITNKEDVKEKRLTHNSTSSCGLVKKQRLQGKKKGDATTGSSTNVLSPAAP